jgi:glycosyltransferase involved in cell wall biosynthesis
VVQRLALGLAARGHHVRVACLMTGGGVAEELRAAGIPVISLEADRRGGVSAALALLRLLREPVEVLHTFLFHSNLLGRVVGAMARVPTIVSERSVESGKAAWRVRVDRLTWRLARRWTANSREVARVLEQREGIDARRIDTIPNGIDTAHFAEHVSAVEFRSRMGIQPGDRVVVCVGRLDPLKGQTTLVRAFRDVVASEPRARLCLVGDGADRAALARHVDEFRLGDRVTFAGTIADVREALAAADVFVLPSNEEGLPGSVMEAQAAGVPVVATAVGGTPELVQHEHTGLLVPPRDAGALSEAIVRLLRDSDLAQRLAAAARASVQELSVDRMVDTTIAMYRRVRSGENASKSAVAA